MLDNLRMYGRYSVALPRYVRSRFSAEDAGALLRDGLERRSRSFLDVMRRGVFDRPGPYRALVDAAGIEEGDIAELVRTDGVEGCLTRLHDAGVHVTLDEFKGRTPIRRGSLELPVRHEDFDNPLAVAHLPGRSGGSGGIHRRAFIDLALMSQEAAVRTMFAIAHDVAGRRRAVWRPGPPDVSGLVAILCDAKAGRRFDRWFVQREHSPRRGALKYWLFTGYTRLACRAAGVPVPRLEYTPLDDAAKVAHWLAERKREGTPAYLDSLVSSAMRVCHAAQELGLDIAGTFMRVGSEPFTPARAAVAERAGCTISCHYAMIEAGVIGVGCARPAAVDDVHLVSDKLAVLRLPRPGRAGNANGRAFHLTTLSPACPKLMINVESGDDGVIEHRRCGCALGDAGYGTHLRDLRSYEKLTSEGMTFHESDLLEIVDEILPHAFGGGPTDYQFVEREENGLTVVSVIVSPRIGALDEDRLAALVLQRLSAGSAGNVLMTDVWRQASTLRVERREPIATGARKVLPLHVERSGTGHA